MSAMVACYNSVKAQQSPRSDICTLGEKSKQKTPDASTADKRQKWSMQSTWSTGFLHNLYSEKAFQSSINLPWCKVSLCNWSIWPQRDDPSNMILDQVLTCIGTPKVDFTFQEKATWARQMRDQGQGSDTTKNQPGSQQAHRCTRHSSISAHFKQPRNNQKAENFSPLF